ncbi:MAG TPA: hypothetical protein VIP11_26145 [Gemmatimonadaceae bacterium]
MRTFSQWIGAVIISLYPKSRVEGIRVIFTDIAVDRAECVARIHRAVNAMQVAGKPYKSLISRIRYIVIWPGNRTFADNAGGIHIASGDLLGIDELALASVFVHESVHLRIGARGIKYDPACRERIERLCIEVQARFLRNTPGRGEEMAREAEAVLAFPWWTREERESDLERLLDEHQLPKWLRAVVPRS